MLQPKQRAVFLDRDGVINRAIIKQGKPYPPSTLAELDVPADVLPSLQKLKAAGFLLIGATNQPDVARGTTSRDLVEAINAQLLATLPMDDILVCYHDSGDACGCRKPAPGLLLEAARRYHIDLSKSYMVGDRWRDVEAGQRAGCKTVWLDYAYAEPGPKVAPKYRTNSLVDAVEWIYENDDASQAMAKLRS